MEQINESKQTCSFDKQLPSVLVTIMSVGQYPMRDKIIHPNMITMLNTSMSNEHGMSVQGWLFFICLRNKLQGQL